MLYCITTTNTTTAVLLYTVYADISTISANKEQSTVQANLSWKCDALALSNQVTHKLQLMRY